MVSNDIGTVFSKGDFNNYWLIG